MESIIYLWKAIKMAKFDNKKLNCKSPHQTFVFLFFFRRGAIAWAEKNTYNRFLSSIIIISNLHCTEPNNVYFNKRLLRISFFFQFYFRADAVHNKPKGATLCVLNKWKVFTISSSIIICTNLCKSKLVKSPLKYPKSNIAVDGRKKEANICAL